MSIFSLFNTTTVVGPTATTAVNCFDREKGTLKFDYNENNAKKTLKGAGMTAIGVCISSSLQFGGELSTTYLADLYADSLSEEQIAEMEQLLAAKENEFMVNGVSYDLTKVDPVEGNYEPEKSTDANVLIKL